MTSNHTTQNSSKTLIESRERTEIDFIYKYTKKRILSVLAYLWRFDGFTVLDYIKSMEIMYKQFPEYEIAGIEQNILEKVHYKILDRQLEKDNIDDVLLALKNENKNVKLFYYEITNKILKETNNG